MTDPLTAGRFVELADAYGGMIARWPEAVRAEASVMAARPAMHAILEEAGWLDACLDSWRVASPSSALRDLVVASRSALPIRRARLWWSSLVVAAALAGAAAGSVAAAAVLPPTHPISDDATAFGDLAR